MASGTGRSQKERIQKDLNKDSSSYKYCSPPGRTAESAGLAEMKPGILPFRNFRESIGFPTAHGLGGGETVTGPGWEPSFAQNFLAAGCSSSDRHPRGCSCRVHLSISC